MRSFRDLTKMAAGRDVLLAAILMLFLFMAPSCAVFRSVSKSTVDSISLKYSESQSSTALRAEFDRETEFAYTDSDKTSYMIKIIPEGEFSFSPAGAFKGKAKSLVVSGNQAGWNTGNFKSSKMEQLKFESINSYKTESKEELKTREKELKRKGKRFGFWAGLLCLMVLGLYLRWGWRNR